jgi:hypothetical protein
MSEHTATALSLVVELSHKARQIKDQPELSEEIQEIARQIRLEISKSEDWLNKTAIPCALPPQVNR